MNTKKMSKIEKIELLYSLAKTEPTQYVTLNDVQSILNSDELEKFHEFMTGQGCPLIGNEQCYFPWDVSKFIRSYTK